MPYNFPSNPTEGQEYVPPTGGQTYVYHAPRWLVQGIPPVAGSGGSTGIGEAPEDGKQYGRQIATWTEVPANPDWTTLAGKPATFPPTLPINESDVTNLTVDLALKAPLDSPVFTGDPRAPTPTLTDNDTSVATTSFVQTAIVNGGVPAGAVEMFARTTPPTGWLKANGALVSRTAYAALFAACGTTFGVGDGTTTFALPDLRGEFLRAWDDTRGVDASRVFGTAQADDLESHEHTFTGSALGTHNHTASSGTVSADHSHTFSDASSTTGGESVDHSHNYTRPLSVTDADRGLYSSTWSIDANQTVASTGRNVGHTHTVAVSGTTSGISTNHTHAITNVAISAGTPAGTVGSFGGTETRPRNIALLACIKY